MRRITAVAGLTGPLLVRRFLADYTRNPVNLLVLVLVPVAFVAGAAGSLAQLARLLSGTMAPGGDGLYRRAGRHCPRQQPGELGERAGRASHERGRHENQHEQVDRVAGVIGQEPARQQRAGRPCGRCWRSHRSTALPSRRATMRSKRSSSVTKWLMIRTARPAVRRRATRSQNFW